MYKEEDFRVVLCGSSAYEKKYYFNQKFKSLPESVREELQIICVSFTEEVGGIFTIGFIPTGEVVMDTRVKEGDLLYDEIGSALLIKKIRSSKQELFESLEIYYRVTFLHEKPGDLLDRDEEEDDAE